MLAPSGAQSACTYIWIPLPRSPAACVTAGHSLGYNYPQLSLSSNGSPSAGASTTDTQSIRVPLTDSVATQFRRKRFSWVMPAAVMAVTDQRLPTALESFQILATEVVPTRHIDKPRRKPTYSIRRISKYFGPALALPT
ncbi:hypothetical protein DPSP01_009376 [Paraphaeosphaeria sporulosa]